jgi:hypothetical protein
MNTPKHFVIQLGSLITLYVSITSLLVLIFSITNLKFPDEAASYWEDESAREAIRVSIAMLVVFFPAYLGLTRVSNQSRRKELHGKYSTFAKWLVYLSLLVSAGIVLIDLVVLINFFLNGEITQRFLVKVFALLVVVGAAFQYYALDIRNYFYNRVKASLYFALGATVVVVVALALGYSYIETPTEVREMRLDEQQVDDLRNVYWQVEESYQAHTVLPESMEELYQDGGLPEAPTGRDAYAYAVTDATTFELCATFAHPSQDTEFGRVAPVTEKNYNWAHESGEKCFTRTVRTDDLRN